MPITRLHWLEKSLMYLRYLNFKICNKIKTHHHHTAATRLGQSGVTLSLKHFCLPPTIFSSKCYRMACMPAGYKFILSLFKNNHFLLFFKKTRQQSGLPFPNRFLPICLCFILHANSSFDNTRSFFMCIVPRHQSSTLHTFISVLFINT